MKDIKVLISEEELKSRVKELGDEITKDFEGKTPVVIGVLKGAIIFMADLIREMKVNCRLDFMSVSSYGSSTKSSGVVKILKDIDIDISGMDVLIIEDIVDSGLTLNYLKHYLSSKNANSIKICTLLDKPHRRQVEIEVDYSGFEIEDRFLIGYGLDADQSYRNLPYIGYID